MTKMSSKTWLAKPPGSCCLQGTLHSGTPRGQFRLVAGVETYITHAHSPNGHILLYFPDVWGMFTNGLLVMDTFADAGYTVIGLDYFRGVCLYPEQLTRIQTNGSRTPYGSTGVIDTINQIHHLTMKHGKPSI
jgi:hypothetical protein